MQMDSAIHLKKRFLSGELSASDIVKETLKNIKAKDGSIGAFLSLTEEYALKKADQLDKKKQKGEPLGKLAGIPIALKDNAMMQGHICTCASKFLENFQAPYNASIVDYINQEDGIIVGKTNLDEFSMGGSGEKSAFYPTKNPWNLGFSPGGSSSGSAAAVAAGFVPLAIGSDTGGSIRQPASFCGIVGMKPSYSRVSRYGLVAFGSSFDQFGPMGHSVEDVQLLMETIAKPCSYDSTYNTEPFVPESLQQTGLKNKKFGVPYAALEGLNVEMREKFELSLNVLRSLGGEVVDVQLPLLRLGIAVYYILAVAEASTNLARFDGIKYGKRAMHYDSLQALYEASREEGFGLEVKNRILLGTFLLSSGHQEEYLQQAQKVRTLMIHDINAAFTQCDFIALPSSPGTATALGSISAGLQAYLQDLYTVGANLTGIPSINVPGGLSSSGMPVGFQIMGKSMQDSQVLKVAYEYTKENPFDVRCFV